MAKKPKTLLIGPEDRAKVEQMVGVGGPAVFGDICAQYIDPATGRVLTVRKFKKLFRTEIQRGFAKARLLAADRQFQLDLDLDPEGLRRTIDDRERSIHESERFEPVPWVPYSPTRRDRREVMSMVALGLTPYDIGQILEDSKGLPIGENGVKTHFARELATGLPLVIYQVGGGALRKALRGDGKMQRFLLNKLGPAFKELPKDPGRSNPGDAEGLEIRIIGGLPRRREDR